MNEHVQHADSIDHLQEQLRKAFPSAAFVGPVTPVDGSNDEQYDDERALQSALLKRSWAEVPAHFILMHTDSLPLLTKEAFAAFLPAWLYCGLTERSVRDSLISVFDKGNHETTAFMDSRIRCLTSAQREAVEAVLAHWGRRSDSISLREEIQRCIAHLRGASD